MNEYQLSKLAGAEIFRLAIKHIQNQSWNHNSMDILLAMTPGKIWPQPMAVLMFSELETALGSETLTTFDKRVDDQMEVINLFSRVASSLEKA